MLPQLSEREKRILFIIRMWQHERRYSPTTGQIAEKYGVAKQTIQDVVESLVKKGYIEMSPHENWRLRRVLLPKGTSFPWGNEQLPDELFSHMKERNVNG